MTMKNLFILVVAMFVATNLFSQKYKGYVVDKNDVSITGASVYYKNTNIGTITDLNGYFELPIEEDKSVIVVEFYEIKKEINLADERKILQKICINCPDKSYLAKNEKN